MTIRRRAAAAGLALALLISGVAPVALGRTGDTHPGAGHDVRPFATGAVPAQGDVQFDRPSRSARTSRLSSSLARVAAAATTADGQPGALATARNAGLRVARSTVQVEISVERGGERAVREEVRAAGGTVTGAGRSGRVLQAFLPAAALERIGGHASVVRVAAPQPLQPLAGAFMSEGDARLNGPAWRGAGEDGTGARVGIIDIGFAGYGDLLGSELPATVAARNFVDYESDDEVDGTDVHGTACAEIIHDVAPGASLYLAKVATLLDVEEAAAWLVDEGVDVISMSIGAHNMGPGDGSGWFEDIVADTRAAGTLWLAAAGNERQRHWGGAGSFDAIGFQLFASGQNINFFGPGDGSAYWLPAGYVFKVALRWSDWSAPVNQDYDVLLVRWSGYEWEALADYGDQYGGFDIQSGSSWHTPTELAFGITSGASTAYGVVIARYSASGTTNFELFTDFELDRQVASRSLVSTAAASSILSVGAIEQDTFAQQPYSSQGPTNGPGGTATGGGVEPDLAAYSEVSTASYGSHQFDGTSAAAPHAAAAAALAVGADASLGPDEIAQWLAARAIDLGTTGKDNRFGHGRVHLGSPPGTAELDPPLVSAPDLDFRSAALAGTKVPLRVAFGASDTSGISLTELQQKVGTNPFASLALPGATATALDLSFAAGATVRQYRARATDGAANRSGWATGPALRVGARHDGASSVVQGGAWSTASSTSYYGGSARHAATAGRYQRLTAAMSDIALVSTRGPNRGIAQVWLDGALVATIDLYAATTRYRQLVWTHDFGSSAAAHTVELRVTGTKSSASSGRRVDFDAWLVIGP